MGERGPKKPESSDPTLHRSIVYDYGVFDMAEEMAGKGRLTEWAEPTPLFRYPTGMDKWPTPSGGHVDGYGQKDLTVAGFTIAATVYLNDIKSSFRRILRVAGHTCKDGGLFQVAFFAECESPVFRSQRASPIRFTWGRLLICPIQWRLQVPRVR